MNEMSAHWWAAQTTRGLRPVLTTVLFLLQHGPEVDGEIIRAHLEGLDYGVEGVGWVAAAESGVVLSGLSSELTVGSLPRRPRYRPRCLLAANSEPAAAAERPKQVAEAEAG